MKIVKLDKEDTAKVTVEFSLREVNAIRTMLNKSVAMDEKHGFLINRLTQTLVWEFNCIRNIAANGMIGPGDAMAWVDKLAEKVLKPDDSKAKVETETEAEASEFMKLRISRDTGEISRVSEEPLSEVGTSEEVDSSKN